MAERHITAKVILLQIGLHVDNSHFKSASVDRCMQEQCYYRESSTQPHDTQLVSRWSNANQTGLTGGSTTNVPEVSIFPRRLDVRAVSFVGTDYRLLTQVTA